MGVKKDFKKGDKVHYIPYQGAPFSEQENGIVKEVHPTGEAAWVVYKCGGDWDNFMDYTGALTDYLDLQAGWVTPTEENFEEEEQP